MKRSEPKLDIESIASLVWIMDDCHRNGLLFEAQLREARKQFAQEVRAKADATPIT